MPCLLGIVALITPRVVIVLLVVFTDYIGRAYDSFLWPFLGFLFMPLTTLAYAWAINANGSVDGIYLVAVVVAVLLDLGGYGSGPRWRRQWRGRRRRFS